MSLTYMFQEVKMKNTGPNYVMLSSELFINKFEARNNCKVQGVLFNKYMTLLHRDLKRKGFDIGLPHCWYRWGDEVVRYNMPYISWDHEYAAYTQVSWRGERNTPNINGDEVMTFASEYADQFIDNYSGEEGAELAIDEVYDQAPFGFQNDYRKLRESLKNISNNKTSMFSNTANVAGSLFEDAMTNFPHEFSVIKKEKDQFESVFRMMMDNNAPTYDLFNISEDFWFYFCYYLRLNKKCHENVSNSTLAVWKEKIPEEKDQFYLKLQSYSHEYGKDSTDANVMILNKTWNENDSTLDDMLSELPDDDGDELNKFVHTIRKGEK